MLPMLLLVNLLTDLRGQQRKIEDPLWLVSSFHDDKQRRNTELFNHHPISANASLLPLSTDHAANIMGYKETDINLQKKMNTKKSSYNFTSVTAFHRVFTVLCYIVILYYRVRIQQGLMILKLDYIYIFPYCLHNYELCFKLTYYTLIHSAAQIICWKYFSLKKMSCGIWGGGG